MIDITMVIDVIIRDYSDPPHLQLLVDNMCRILHSTLSMPMQADSCHPLLSQLHGLVHGTQPLFILGRALGHPVLRPEGPAEVGTERTAADRYHLADDIEVVDGLQCYLLAAHPVAAYCQGCTHFVAQDVGVLCHHGPAAVRHGLGLGAQVALVHRGANDDTVGSFQAVVEFLHVIFVDATAALPDAVVTVDSEVEVFATGWEIPGFCAVFFFEVFEGFIYNVIC